MWWEHVLGFNCHSPTSIHDLSAKLEMTHAQDFQVNFILLVKEHVFICFLIFLEIYSLKLKNKIKSKSMFK